MNILVTPNTLKNFIFLLLWNKKTHKLLPFRKSRYGTKPRYKFYKIYK